MATFVISYGRRLPMKEGRAIRYYHYEAPTKSSKRLPPLVFMHGIGIGNIPYFQFLKRLIREFPHRSIVLVRYLTHDAPPLLWCR